MGAFSNGNIFSKTAMNIVVSVEPTKVFSAMDFPSIMSASRSRSTFITVNIDPGDCSQKAVRMTEIPVVPPRNSDCGNMKNTVAKPYRMLPSKMRRYSVVSFFSWGFILNFLLFKILTLIISRNTDADSSPMMCPLHFVLYFVIGHRISKAFCFFDHFRYF